MSSTETFTIRARKIRLTPGLVKQRWLELRDVARAATQYRLRYEAGLSELRTAARHQGVGRLVDQAMAEFPAEV